MRFRLRTLCRLMTLGSLLSSLAANRRRACNIFARCLLTLDGAQMVTMPQSPKSVLEGDEAHRARARRPKLFFWAARERERARDEFSSKGNVQGRGLLYRVAIAMSRR